MDVIEGGDEQTRAQQAAQRVAGGKGDGGSVSSIADRAAAGDNELEPDEQAELFPLGSLEGDAKTLRNVFKSGIPVETTVSLMAAEVPLNSGLIDPEKSGQVLVTYAPHKVEVVVKREEGRIVAYKVRQILRPDYVEAVAAAEPAAAAQ